MKKYAVTTTKFEGTVTYGFDANGWLASVEIDNVHEQHAHAGVCSALPKREAELLKWVELNKSMHITELVEDISFDTFWTKYNYKVSKKDAEKAWKNTVDANKVIAIKSIPAYDKWLQTKSQPKVYPATYLNKERYFDDFTK